MRLPNNANASLALFLGRNILIVPYYKLETFFFGKLNGVSHETKCIFNSSIQEFQAYLSLFFLLLFIQVFLTYIFRKLNVFR